MDAKYDADTKIADAAREYQMQKANYDMEVNGAVSALYMCMYCICTNT